MSFKSGFVSLLGKPNAGKSTLLNALVGEKMAIVSPKVQTTRHRIKAFLNGPDYQIIFSDTPGVIEPQYKLQEKMMRQVKLAIEDADLVLLVHDVAEKTETEVGQFFASLHTRVPGLLVLNKADLLSPTEMTDIVGLLESTGTFSRVLPISAKHGTGITELIGQVVDHLPAGPAFFDKEDLTDLPTRFFVAEMIREKIFGLYHQELPYQSTVLVQEFKEKETLIKIRADVVVHRESQKAIVLGERGKLIRELGTQSRLEIEKFLGRKVFLELFVKVRPKWRDQDLYLKEYGYD
jgi:GTP-binding protein Era